MIMHNVTFDCAEPYALATFWSAVTGWPIATEDGPDDTEVLVEAPAPSPGLLFIQVPEEKSVKNRVHLDLSPSEGTRDENVARIIGLGAKLHGDFRTADGLGWVTLLDPEGNEFCIERSQSERAGTN